MKVYMMMGIPASGKSSKSKEFAEKENLQILSNDEVRIELFGNCDNCFSDYENRLVYKTVTERMEYNLQNRISFIHDATNVTKRSRKRLLDLCKKYDVEVIGVMMLTHFENCIKNNKNRDRKVPEETIYSMAQKCEYPLGSEGFSGLYKIKDRGVE